jgi:hypothetical protein
MRNLRTILTVIAVFAAAFLGCAVGVCLTLFAKLPDHTVDLLTFTESAFGIGMTVIALVFSLVTVNQVREIDRRFDEKSKEFDGRFDEMRKEFEQRFTHSMEVFAHNTASMTTTDSKGVNPHQIAASMSQVGLGNITPHGLTTANLTVVEEPSRKKSHLGKAKE